MTPLGPLAGIALGIKKSVQEIKTAKANQKAAATVKANALGPAASAAKMAAGIKGMKPSASKPATKPTGKAPKPPQSPQELKKTLNNAFPGLNMK